MGWQELAGQGIQYLNNNIKEPQSTTRQTPFPFRSLLRSRLIPALDGFVTLTPDSLRRRAEAVEVAPTPRGDGGVAYYKAPPTQEANGTFFMNVESGGWRRYKALALLLHETLPGHHYQYVSRQQQSLVPDFARYGFYHGLNSVPSRPPIHTAHSEGWGLYSETLGRQMGVYDEEDEGDKIHHLAGSVCSSVVPDPLKQILSILSGLEALTKKFR